jgi:hypothetical protein
MVRLGDRVKDQISGLVGIATGRAEYLYGCVRVVVSPTVEKDGKPVEGSWFDEEQLILIEAGALLPKSKPEPAISTGGPRPDATRRDDPAGGGR